MQKKLNFVLSDSNLSKKLKNQQAYTSRIRIQPRCANSKSSKVSPDSKVLSKRLSEVILPGDQKLIKKVQSHRHLSKPKKNIETKGNTPRLSPTNYLKFNHRRVHSESIPVFSKYSKPRDPQTDQTNLESRPIKTSSGSKLRSINEKIRSRESSPYLGSEDQEKLLLTKKILKHFTSHLSCPDTTIDFYRVISLIGKGAFAKVLLCEQKLTGKKVAVKAIPKENLQTSRSQKKVVREVFILKKIKSKYVIKILEVFESEKNFLIVMEHAGGGDLLHYVREKKKLKEEEAKRIFKQIILGTVSIHQAGVLHRDFKLDNILLDSTYSTIKICDFGVSKIVKEGELILDQCGTPAYLAPEIIKNEGYSGFNADIWSLGVVLYAMLCGTIPFKAGNIVDLHKVILQGHFDLPEDLSDSAKDLISRMLKLNPYERISLEDSLKHKWFLVRSKEVDHSIPQFFPRIVTERDEEIRERVVKQVSEFGFDYEFIIKSLKHDDMNHATVSYFLLL